MAGRLSKIRKSHPLLSRIEQAGDFCHLQNMNMDFSTFLAPAEDMPNKDDELEVDGFVTNKIKSLPLKSELSKPQCFEEAPQKNVENLSTKSGPSANEEIRSTGSVAGKVFTGYLSAGSNCLGLLLVLATNIFCQVIIIIQPILINKIVVEYQSISYKD